MDPTRFDHLALTLSAAPSRRRFVAGLASSAVGTLAAALGVTNGEATHFVCRHVGEPCRRKGQCCSGRCRNNRCRAHHTGICTAGQDQCSGTSVACGTNGPAVCLCLITTGGASFCGGDTGGPNCTKDKECETLFGRGAACIECGPQTFCGQKCPDPD